MAQKLILNTFRVSLQVEIQQRQIHNLTSLSSGRPASPLRRFRTAIVAIAVLVSRVAEPICGRSTQLARFLSAKVAKAAPLPLYSPGFMKQRMVQTDVGFAFYDIETCPVYHTLLEHPDQCACVHQAASRHVDQNGGLLHPS
jgi:hypothetical protein